MEKRIASRDRTVYENYKKVRKRVKKVTAKLCQEEQHKISLECKRSPKKFRQYVNKKTKFKTAVSDLHWMDSMENRLLQKVIATRQLITRLLFLCVYC